MTAEWQKAIENRLLSIEGKLDLILTELGGRKRAATTRRKHYREAKARREKGKVALPRHHILKGRDARWVRKVPALVCAVGTSVVSV